MPDSDYLDLKGFTCIPNFMQNNSCSPRLKQERHWYDPLKACVLSFSSTFLGWSNKNFPLAMPLQRQKSPYKHL